MYNVSKLEMSFSMGGVCPSRAIYDIITNIKILVFNNFNFSILKIGKLMIFFNMFPWWR